MYVLSFILAFLAGLIAVYVLQFKKTPWGLVMVYWSVLTAYWILSALGVR